MIKFFRRIRSGLLRENKYRKYLLYAIGEIALVMIGILLALQINNWNQTRMNRVSEKEVINSILLNLKEDESNISKSRERYQISRGHIKRVFDGPAIPNDSIAFVSTRIMGNAPFFHNQTAFDLAINSGVLNLIRDKGLIQKIQNFYSYKNNSPKSLVEELSKTQGYIREISMEYESLLLEDIDRGDFFNSTYEMPFDIPKLKRRNEDPRLLTHLRDNHFNMGILIDFYNQIESSNFELQKDITDYLETNY